MQNFSSMSHHELNAKISDSQIRVMQVLFIAMGLALMLMIAVVTGFYISGQSRAMQVEPTNRAHLNIMVLALIFIAFLEYMLFFIIPKMRLAMSGVTLMPGKLQHDQDQVSQFMSLYRSVTIIRLALLEGVAIFGIMIILVATIEFVIYTQPVYWLCLAPAVILFAYIYLFFPIRERVIFYIENNFIKPGN